MISPYYPYLTKLRSPVAAARMSAPLGAMQRPVRSQALRAACCGLTRKSASSRTRAVLLSGGGFWMVLVKYLVVLCWASQLLGSFEEKKINTPSGLTVDLSATAKTISALRSCHLSNILKCHLSKPPPLSFF